MCEKHRDNPVVFQLNIIKILSRGRLINVDALSSFLALSFGTILCRTGTAALNAWLVFLGVQMMHWGTLLLLHCCNYRDQCIDYVHLCQTKVAFVIQISQELVLQSASEVIWSCSSHQRTITFICKCSFVLVCWIKDTETACKNDAIQTDHCSLCSVR